MTQNEAEERAAKLWPGKRLKIEITRYGNGAHVLDLDADIPHNMDSNGHPMCHEACVRFEVENL